MPKARSPSSPPIRHVALLRGVNVGGKNALPMRELVALFEAAGASDVSTYVQSGNVVFACDGRGLAALVAGVERAIEARFGFRAPLVTRTRDELLSVARDDPFAARGIAERERHVAFLAGEPSDAARARLDPARSPGDAFVARGREVYLHLPNGVARTKLTNAWLDATLGTTSTIRNARTIAALVERVR